MTLKKIIFSQAIGLMRGNHQNIKFKQYLKERTVKEEAYHSLYYEEEKWTPKLKQ